MKFLSLKLFTVLLVTVMACQSDQNDTLLSIEEDLTSEARISPSSDFPGKVPADLSFWDVVLHPQDHSWEDLDDYFRNDLPKHKGEEYYSNLESVLFSHLIGQFNIDREADLETVLFYTKRQFQRDFLAEPELFVRCLERLDEDGYSPRFLAPYVIGVHDRLMKTISEMDDPDAYLVKHGHKYHTLEQFEAELKERLNMSEED
ncbi:MAG: hypothetical protein EA411_03705 [Saprospirales bacterium]|nr:MAG: hypothetical protein EA411_03705 [Saprospirales bacterium]